VLWTEAAFSEHLAWYWPDHHWQYNWQVACATSRMCVGKRRTLRAIQPHDKGCFSFCQMWQFLDLLLFGNYHKFKLLTFAR